jgi:hypothetical protein
MPNVHDWTWGMSIAPLRGESYGGHYHDVYEWPPRECISRWADRPSFFEGF